MATVREGNKAVLVVVDVQVGVMAECWDSFRIVGNIARVVARARKQGAPVLWVQHSDAQLAQGSPEWEWVPDLPRRDGERLFHKNYNSAFEKTDLEAELARLGATRLVLAGAATNWCIRATAYAALERGYDLTLVSDAHTTVALDLKGGRRIEPADVIDELNIAMKWLSYPGRANDTVAAEEVDFRSPGIPAAR